MSLLTEISENLFITVDEAQKIIETAPARYKVYDISKRDGGRRRIAHPARELKAIQRYVLYTKLTLFPVHPAAMGYVAGRSIVGNARIHAGHRVVLKMDFKSFFTSIKVEDFRQYCANDRKRRLDREDIEAYCKVLFWGQKKKSYTPRCLSIGAPTSPTLSNILMYDIDSKIADIIGDRMVNYSRYADDITISGDSVDIVLGVEAEIRKIVRETRSPRLRFNEEKRGLFQRGQRQMVTGLVLTPVGGVSIGRARKREISALVHRASFGDDDEMLTVDRMEGSERAYLKGMLGFCIAAEPDFVERLREKYGNEVIDAALSYEEPSRE